MDFWTFYLIAIPVSLVLFWAGFVLHWRGENLPINSGDIKFLVLYSALCLVPIIQIMIPITIWFVTIPYAIGRCWDRYSGGRSLQKIADKVNSIIHYKKV